MQGIGIENIGQGSIVLIEIEGDVHYEALTIEQGAQVDGRFAHGARNRSTDVSAKPASESEKPASADEPKLGLVS